MTTVQEVQNELNMTNDLSVNIVMTEKEAHEQRCNASLQNFENMSFKLDDLCLACGVPAFCHRSGNIAADNQFTKTKDNNDRGQSIYHIIYHMMLLSDYIYIHIHMH